MKSGSQFGSEGVSSIKEDGASFEDLGRGSPAATSVFESGVWPAANATADLSVAPTYAEAFRKIVRPGCRIGEWKLKERCGQGAFSDVWLAEHITCNDSMGAVKIANDANAAALLGAEANALNSLNHPNIVRWLAADPTQRPGYLVTEFVDGPTLREAIPARGFPSGKAISIARQVLEGLEHAHGREVIHGDLKPENVILKDERLVLVDFAPLQALGTVRSLQAWVSARTRQTLGPGGTIAYMSPEERQGEPITVQTDIYQFGILLHEILTGKLPDGNHELPSHLRSRLNPLWDQIFREATCGRGHRAKNVSRLLALIEQLERSRREPRPSGRPHGSPSNEERRQTATRRDNSAVEWKRQATMSKDEAVRQSVTRELVVSPADEKAFPTIAAAIKAATPGSRILVRPGRYNESIVIDKDVEIVGDGKQSDIVLQSRDKPCITVRTKLACCRGITLRARTRNVAETPSLFAAIRVRRGTLGLFDCDISCDSYACISAEGKATRADVRGCQIRGGLIGLHYSDRAAGHVEECHVFNHAQAGVKVSTGAHPLLKKCQIYDGHGVGVAVVNGGRGTVSSCEIFQVKNGLTICGEGSDPAVTGSRIHDTRGAAIIVFDAGDGTVEDCRIWNAAGAGVVIQGAANPYVRRCDISRCVTAGVQVDARGEGRIEHCKIHDNDGVGILVRDGGDTFAEHCRLGPNNTVGISISAKGIATVRKCKLSGNRKGPESYASGCRVRAVDNTVGLWEWITGSRSSSR